MVFKCSIPGCKNKTSPDIPMHSLPKDYEIRRMWCQALRRPDLIDVSGRSRHAFRICDVHFAEDAKFTRNRKRSNLKCDAVPTLYLREQSDASDVISDADMLPCTSTSHVPDVDQPVCVIPTPGEKGSSKMRTNILRSVGVRRIADLTPKAKKLYTVAKDLQKITRRLDFQNASNKKRLTKALEYSQTVDFQEAKLNQRCINFINCQVKMLRKKSRGRRFTFEDKVFALSLLKQGPRAYKLLRSTFALPSRKTLINVLNKIHFDVGLNPKVMEVLKNSIGKLDYLDRHCVLMFDEISLEPGLVYDKKWDSVIGFQHIGMEKRMQFADHGLVFMVQGLRKKWKQPISFYFSQGGMKSDQLKVILKKTILALQEIGLIIVCTVCDQFSANRACIKKLKEESLRPYSHSIDIFEIGGQEIVAIYDPPHMLKCFRNMLLQYNLCFTYDNVLKEASWSDIIKLYELDEGDFTTRMCYKLTDAHVYKEKLKKMKVKHAAQVFSHRVSSTMRWTVKYGKEGTLPKSADDTAILISFMDQVFDSVNGSNNEADHGKLLRCAISQNSPHLQFWENGIKVFQTMKFKVEKRGESLTPTITNWIKVLRGFIYIWRKLSNIGFKYLCLRRINQDPLENFFGCIRSHGVRNINPTCYSFISSFKTLIINNLSAPHSSNANCENDESNLLDSLKLLLSESKENTDTSEHDVNIIFDVKVAFDSTKDKSVIATHAYIAGYMVRNIKKKIANCATCVNQMQAPSSSEEHTFVLENEYRPHSLIKSRTQFRRLFSNMCLLFMECIEYFILGTNLKKKLSVIFKRKLYNPFLCTTHTLFEICIESFLNFFIFTYLKNINSILRGCTQYNLKDKNKLKQLASQRYLALKGKNRKVAILKRLTK